MFFHRYSRHWDLPQDQRETHTQHSAWHLSTQYMMDEYQSGRPWDPGTQTSPLEFFVIYSIGRILSSLSEGKRQLTEWQYFPLHVQTKPEINSSRNILGHQEQWQMMQMKERSSYLAKNRLRIGKSTLSLLLPAAHARDQTGSTYHLPLLIYHNLILTEHFLQVVFDLAEHFSIALWQQNDS